jgi:hypothetical protein
MLVLRRLLMVGAVAVALVGWTVAQYGGKGNQPTDDIPTVAVKAGQFKTLVKALEAAELVDALKGKGPFTVFAPTDSAFRQTAQRHAGRIAPARKQGETPLHPALPCRSWQVSLVGCAQTQKWHESGNPAEGQKGHHHQKAQGHFRGRGEGHQGRCDGEQWRHPCH